MNPNIQPKTSAQFASDVGIHYSMASRLRSGERRPSYELLIRITDKYGLDLADAVRAAHDNEFGRFLDDRVFKPRQPAAA